jgi:hypothetical protein
MYRLRTDGSFLLLLLLLLLLTKVPVVLRQVFS